MEIEAVNKALLEGLAESFTALYYVDLDRGTYWSYVATDRIADVSRHCQMLPTYHDLYMSIVESDSVHPDSRQRMRDLYKSNESLRDALVGKKRVSVLFLGKYSEGYRWTKVSVVKCEPVDAAARRVVFCFNECDDEVRRQKEAEGLSAFANYFIETFVSTYYLNLDTHEFQVYKRKSDLEENYPVTRDYVDSLAAYIARDVHPEDRAALTAFTDPVNLSTLLKEKPIVEHVYRDVSGGTEKYYRFQAIRGEKASMAAFTFQDVTDLERDRCARRHAQREALASAERANRRAEAISRIVKSATWSVTFNARHEIVASEYSDELCSVLRNDVRDNEGWIHLIHPDDRERAVSESLGVLSRESGKDQFDSEYRILSRGGAYHWVRSAGRVVFNADGGGEMYGICMDIEDRVRQREERQRKLEKAVRELQSEKRRADIVRDVIHSAQWRFKLSADDRIVDYEFSRDIGKLVKNEKASLSYDWRELVHPDDYERTIRSFEATLKDHDCRTPYDVTFRMVDRDGNYNWFRSAGNVFRSADGSGEFFGIHIDVTEQRREQERHQRELEAARAKDAILVQVVKARYGYNVTIDLATMKCSVIRGTGCEGAVAVFERCSTYKEVVEEFSSRVADPERLRLIQELFAADSLWKLAAEGKRGYVGSVEYPTMSSNPGEEGMIGWREVHLFIGTDASGVPVANILGRNITAEHEQADARERLQVAEQASRAKSEFLFGMSHDIRTPMHAIKGFADIASKNLDDRETVRDCIGKIQTSGDLLFSLLNSVLDMSRLEVGKVKVVETAVDVRNSFEHVRSTLTEFAREKSIALEFEMGEIVDRYVYADYEKVNRVFVNIISNAIKYTEPGGRIRVACEQMGGERGGSGGTATYRYTFSDNGIGMSEEFQQHVYERFAREENTIFGDVIGVGLGMAISKAFVELMGGTIDFRSTQGVGTTFIVTLTYRLQEGEPEYLDPRTGKTVKVGREEAKLISFKGRRVLLVDDSMFNREVSKHYLQEAGFAVDIAESGQQAVELVTSGGNGYDVVMMDIRMPGLSGLEAAKAIRAWEGQSNTLKSNDRTIRHVPIIAWSANAFAEDREAALAAGMDDHIAKGVQPAVLQECIARHLKS